MSSKFEPLFNAHIGNIEDCLQIKKGQNAFVYKVKSGGLHYVVREGYQNKDTGSSLEKVSAVMDFLHSAGYKHSAKKIIYDADSDVLIETFLEGEIKPLKEYKETEIEAFVKALVSLYAIPPVGTELIPTVSSMDDIVMYGTERLDIANTLLPDERNLINTLTEELEKNIIEVKNRPNEVSAPSFLIHGDIGNNISLNNNVVYFFDWEFSCFSQRTELAYIKIHSQPTEDQFRYIVELFAEETNRDINHLYEEITQEEKVTRLNDIIWAAMRWGETKTNKFSEGRVSHSGETFKQLTVRRMEEYFKFVNEKQ